MMRMRGRAVGMNDEQQSASTREACTLPAVLVGLVVRLVDCMRVIEHFRGPHRTVTSCLRALCAALASSHSKRSLRIGAASPVASKTVSRNVRHCPLLLVAAGITRVAAPIVLSRSRARIARKTPRRSPARSPSAGRRRPPRAWRNQRSQSVDDLTCPTSLTHATHPLSRASAPPVK